MGLFDRIKENIQETATLAREGIGELQVKRELGHAYGELGRRLFDQIDAGTLQASGVEAELARVRELKRQLEAEEAQAAR